MSPLKEINAIFIESNKLINFLYSSMYTPPFTISSRAIHLIADISALVKRYAIRMEQEDALLLRKITELKPFKVHWLLKETPYLKVKLQISLTESI